MSPRDGDTRCPSEETPGIPEKGHNQEPEVSWRRATVGDTGHPSKGLWASQRGDTAGDHKDPGEGLGTMDIQEGVVAGDCRHPTEGPYLGDPGE